MAGDFCVPHGVSVTFWVPMALGSPWFFWGSSGLEIFTTLWSPHGFPVALQSPCDQEGPSWFCGVSVALWGPCGSPQL